MDVCGDDPQIIQCLSSNSPDLHFLYMLYTRGKNPSVVSVLDNPFTLLSLRSKFNLSQPPVHRNTFTELYFEYCESHLTPISYEFLGEETFTEKCLHEDMLGVWIDSLSFMSEEDRSTTLNLPGVTNNMLRGKKNIPSNEQALSLLKYSDDKMILADVALSIACYNGDRDIITDIWNYILTRDTLSEDRLNRILCVWSLAGGHKHYNVSVINSDYTIILKLVIRNKRIEILKELIAYIRANPRDLITDPLGTSSLPGIALETDNVEIIKIVFDTFDSADHISGTMKDLSLDTIKFLDVDLDLGKTLVQRLYTFFSNKTSDVFNYISTKYASEINTDEYFSIALEALFQSHKDVYLKYFQLLSDDDKDELPSKILETISTDWNAGGNLLLEPIFGTEARPTVIVSIDGGEIDILSEKTGILYRYSTEESHDPMRIHLKDPHEECDEIFLGHITSTLRRGQCTDMFKRLVPWLSVENKAKLLIYSIEINMFSIFRFILSTFPRDTDMTQVIAMFHEHKSFHRRFLQIIVRQGYSFNPDLVHPQILSSIKKMM